MITKDTRDIFLLVAAYLHHCKIGTSSLRVQMNILVRNLEFFLDRKVLIRIYYLMGPSYTFRATLLATILYEI